MADQTIPRYGSVESYAGILRPLKREYLETSALAVMQMILGHPRDSAAMKVDLAQNLLAAFEQVRNDPAGDPTGLTYSREADDPTPVSPARQPLHTGAVTNEGLVDETEDDPVCRVCRSRYSKHNALGLSLHGLAPANEYDESLDVLAPCQPIGCDNGHHVPGCFYAKADS